MRKHWIIFAACAICLPIPCWGWEGIGVLPLVLQIFVIVAETILGVVFAGGLELLRLALRLTQICLVSAALWWIANKLGALFESYSHVFKYSQFVLMLLVVLITLTQAPVYFRGESYGHWTNIQGLRNK